MVDDAVQGHGEGACAHHGDDDPEEGRHGRPASGGEEGAGEGEGQGEDAVLELDHVEYEAQFTQNRAPSIGG